MRIELLVADAGHAAATYLRRHAEALAGQFRRTGHACEIASCSLGPTPGGTPPDIVHILHPLDGSPVVARWRGVPVVLHLHPPGEETVGELLPPRQLGPVAAVITHSVALLEAVPECSPDGVPVVLVPLGLQYAPGPWRQGPPDPVGGVRVRAEGGEGGDGPSVPAPGEAGQPFDVAVFPALTYGACSYRAQRAIADRCLLLAPQRPGVLELFQDYRCGITYPDRQAPGPRGLLTMLSAQPELVAELQAGMGFPAGIEEEAFALIEVYRAACLGWSHAGGPYPATVPPGRGPERLIASGMICPMPGETVARSALLLAGWAVLEGGPIARVEVTLNGRCVGPARLGLNRPEVQVHFGTAEAPVSGFELHLDLSELATDVTEATLSVTVLGLDGSRFTLQPITVDVAPSYQPEDEAERRMSAFHRGLPAARPLDLPNLGTEVRLVAFTHDLGYGGAQLYLWEMLRRLAAEPWFSCTVVAPREGPLAQDLEAVGINVHVTAGYPVESIGLYEGKQTELAAWVRSEGFNVVFANTLLGFPGIDLAARLGLPSAWAIHESYALPVFWQVSFPPSAPIHPYVASRAEFALDHASALIFEVEATRRMFERQGGSRTCLTVPYGVDAEALIAYREGLDLPAVRRRLGIPEGATVLLCLGTVQSRKAQTVIAQAFGQIAARHPDAFLVFVGELGDSYAACLKSYLARSGLARRCLVIPLVSDTYEWYCVADLFLSASDVESLPRSVLEAMALDVPVAATRVFGLPELIDDGRTGFLCEPRDLSALVAMLERVLCSPPAFRAAVGRAGGQMVRDANDSSGYAAALGDLFRSLAVRQDA